MHPPNVIEKLSFEEIFSRMKEELIRRDPTFSALIENDPAVKILEVAAWRELLLRQRINEAAKANLLKFAEGSDLDHLAEFYGVERNREEGDEAFRKRIKARIAGWSTGGSKEHYRFHALSADSRVKDALVESPNPGSVQISILSTELSTGGVPSEELLQIVRKQLNSQDIRVLTDTIEVVNCNIMAIDIQSRITAVSEETIEAAKKQFIEKFEAAKRLGWNVTKSWIIASLFVEGVQNVELIEPREDIEIKGNECATLGNLKIEFKS
ncbi:baseplate assembly protein [Wolbachia endosymbiont of Folsomia candida]|uniref:baseplate assembly protein n=1 Tax=Wolbachia endosymbiont of Folsomia candida TaxID=169402 RepID=UPI000B0C96F7|nr:baseplate J/gp47 family protein [Wolbachia endosymbiont of Folsomia candida]APR98554.1 baseplate assembly protein J [Wolbachia endosymbiont of Folsomia candida]APR98960.1 baseplate assembly protein J [Wolbachia endosymbiont of Folsomia candida]